MNTSRRWSSSWSQVLPSWVIVKHCTQLVRYCVSKGQVTFWPSASFTDNIPLPFKIKSKFLGGYKVLLSLTFVFVNLLTSFFPEQTEPLGFTRRDHPVCFLYLDPLPPSSDQRKSMCLQRPPSPVHFRRYPPVKLLFTSLPLSCPVSTVLGQSPLFFQSQQSACLPADISVSFDKWKKEWVTNSSVISSTSPLKSPFFSD